MKSRPIANGMTGNASQLDSARDDGRGGSFLLVHQQLGALALGTLPSNGQVVPIVINGTTITLTAVTSIGSTPNNILIPVSGLAKDFVANVVNFCRRPDITNANQVAASSANQTLLSYVGWALPGASTNIVPFSLNKNINGITGGLTSFNITGITVTSGSWTAQTMQLYIEDGAYYIGTTRVLYTGGSTSTFTAPVSHPRIDLITADSSGTIALVTGSENVSPSAPSYPANKAVLAEVYHIVSETALYDYENQQTNQGYISNDVRPTLLIPYISSLSQVATGLFIEDPGSEAQGDVLYYDGGAWARLPAGTSGYVLSTLGASANPHWVLMAQTATVKDVSGQNITPNCDNAYHTIATYAGIPALATNQTLWIRALVTNGDTHGTNTQSFKLTVNGTDLAVLTAPTNNQQTTYHWDIFVVATTPASAQTFFGTVIAGTGTPTAVSASPLSGSLAANLSSAFSLTIQGKENVGGSPASTSPWTVVACEINIIN